MRPDFGKCVVERARRGSSCRGAKARWYGKLVVDKETGELEYEGPTKLPSSMGSPFHYDDKSFTDVLGPIKGFLRSNCGRPWDKVWSELSQLGQKSWSLRHILRDFELDVFEEGDDFYVKDPKTASWFLCDKAASDTIYRSSYPARRIRRPGEVDPPSVRSLLSGNILTYVDQHHLNYGKEYYFRRRKSLNKKEIKAMLERRDAKLKQRFPSFK